MIRNALIHFVMAFSLLLSGLTSVVAETRMAAAGGYCGTGMPELLLDASGLPLLDGSGTAIAAPDCLACHLSIADLAPAPPRVAAPTLLLHTTESSTPPRLSRRIAPLGAQARAPPRRA